MLEVVVLGRTVLPVEMRDACPSLWLYELECWTIIYEVKTAWTPTSHPRGLGA